MDDVVYWVSSVVQTRQDIEKRISASLKGVKKEAIPVKKMELKFFVSILYPFTNLQFCQIFKKIMFNHFYCCRASAISKVHNDYFFLTMLYKFF